MYFTSDISAEEMAAIYEALGWTPTGPATKITNLGALKIVLGMKRFGLYIVFVMAFSLAVGLIANFVI